VILTGFFVLAVCGRLALRILDRVVIRGAAESVVGRVGTGVGDLGNSRLDLVIVLSWLSIVFCCWIVVRRVAVRKVDRCSCSVLGPASSSLDSILDSSAKT
jgi:hypothetical protein